MPEILNSLIEQVRGQIRDTGPEPVFARAKEKTDTDPAVPDELQEFVMRAVSDYSRWTPLKGKRGTLDLVVGQTDYVLPSDFIEMEELNLAHRISGSTLYLTNTPDDSCSLVFYYNAMHTPDSIPEYDAPAIVMFAAAASIRAMLTDPQKLETFVNYRIPDVYERQDVGGASRLATELLKSAESWEKQYLLRMGVYSGSKGSGGGGATKQSGLESQGAFMCFG